MKTIIQWLILHTFIGISGMSILLLGLNGVISSAMMPPLVILFLLLALYCEISMMFHLPEIEAQEERNGN